MATMTLFKSSTLVCPRDTSCSKWAKENLKYCLCSVKEGFSLTLGLISVLSWGVAEIPQIITNYKEKSTEGLSIVFLTMWMIGDLFNLFGCMMEPATLPTQYYTAVLYTLITAVLFAQAIYYSHIYPRLTHKQSERVAKQRQTDATEKDELSNNEIFARQGRRSGRGIGEADSPDGENTLSSPITLPAGHRHSFPGRELYYTSARSLSSSYTPPAGSFFAQGMTPPSARFGRFLEEPLLQNVSSEPASPRTAKTMLCIVSGFMFLGNLNLHRLKSSGGNMVLETGNQGFVVQATRKLLQVTSSHIDQHGVEGSNGIGTFLGWAMAAIYMSGRIPQICLNMRKGNAKGLNPLMFFFALVGNSTYVASILVNSTEWSRIRPNLPWLVDAGGCVLLDAFILTQFICFGYRSSQVAEDKKEISDFA